MQSLSYAKLAGLSPVYGLYTGLMPMFAYALFGSSRQLSVGPVAIISQVIHSGLMEIVDPTAIGLSATAKRDAQSLYNNLAVTLALFVSVALYLSSSLELLVALFCHSRVRVRTKVGSHCGGICCHDWQKEGLYWALCFQKWFKL